MPNVKESNIFYNIFVTIAIYNVKIGGRTSILQMWILKGYTFNKSSDDFIMNIQ
ncbi:hypothetical protein [Rickettsia endosymbiont of Cantharis rufa]|uniref:hypothetical protein n=1 Tax=Rickettsia endosymbiont of Cantharis rufa TaxID=3066248 RepID=UPI003132FC78